MTISEITTGVLSEYIRTEPSDTLLIPILAAAKAYTKSYTGLTELQLDEHEDLTMAVMILCADLYDNRDMTATTEGTNQLVESILNIHKST